MKKQFAALALLTTLSAPHLAVASESHSNSMVPLRVIANQLGADLEWDAKTSTATMREGDRSLRVQLGSKEAQVQSQVVSLTTPAILKNDRTYVPLQLVEAFGGKSLTWNEVEGRLAIGDMMGFQAQGAVNGSKATYDLQLTMNEAHEFKVTAKVLVENVSSDTWNDAVFYFIPNEFTEQYKNTNNFPHYYDQDGKPILDVDGVPLNDKIQPANVHIDSLKAQGNAATAYKLKGDSLMVSLPTPLKPKEKAEVEVTYSFTLPEPGNRFAKTEVEQVYKLAEWYPMLATYNESGWNKQPYVPYSESYFTDFSDFKLSYELPKGYSLISSADTDLPLGTNKGELTIQNVKEIYAQIDGSPNLKMLTDTVDGVEVRVFGRKGQEEMLQEVLDVATQSLHFYNVNIGPYTHKQLDIMTNDGGMEYPGIVTVWPTKNPNDPLFFHETVAHEIAHQWFNFTVSSDSYKEGWLDEGMTELATSLYMYGVEKQQESNAFRYLRYKRFWDPNMRSTLTLGQMQRPDMLQAYYTQPSYKMWKLFTQNSGTTDPLQTGLQFLKKYYETYQYKQITTKEFVKFAETYFPTGESFYKSWLRVK